jgi:transposase
MEILHRSCCGIDIHKQFLVACLLVVDETGHQRKESRRFSTMTGELLSCIDWLKPGALHRNSHGINRGVLAVAL